MSTLDNHTELFDQFIQGAMTDQDQKDFLLRIEQDSVLKASFDLHKQVIHSFEEEGNKDLKHFLEGLENEKEMDTVVPIQSSAKDVGQVKDQKAAKVFKLSKLIPAVAAGLVILFGSLFLFKTNLSTNHVDLYAQYHTSYPNDLTRIQRSNDTMTPTEKAMLSYSKKEYDMFINQADNLLSSSGALNLRDELSYFKGVSLMELGKFDQAISILSEINSEYSSQAKWYLALCYLKSNELEKAKQILRSMSGEYKQAEKNKLLSTLEEK